MENSFRSLFITLKRSSIYIILFIFYSCSNIQEPDPVKQFEQYYNAVKSGDQDMWKYSEDTIRMWFDDRKGDPILLFQSKKSGGAWREWDEEMNSTSYYDTIWYDKKDHAIKGYFFENNDFYKLIGKTPNKTFRIFWLTDKNKIKELLIYWIPEENEHTSVHLEPIINWAMENHPDEIKKLYQEQKIVPSKENAIKWKMLIRRYNERIKQ